MKTNVLRTSILTMVLAVSGWAGGGCHACAPQHPSNLMDSMSTFFSALFHLFG
jgi:hypothetical protein